MIYKKKSFTTFNLHMIKDDKFKTITMEIIFRDNIKKDEITIRNVLSDILIYSCKKYPTKHEFSAALQDLYNINISASNYRLGNFYNTDINLRFLCEKYTEKGMMKKTLEFLADMIFNPYIKNNQFDEEILEVMKEHAKAQIASIKEDKRKYSMIKMLENMDEKSPFSYHCFGYQEDLDKITPTTLADYYQKFITNSIVDIYIFGDFECDEIEKIIKENFKFKTLKKDKGPAMIYHTKKRKEQIIIDEEKTNQANLVIGCKLLDLTDFERNYVLTVYNFILGGSADSKLFRNVREKNSLCYSISSIANKLDNLLFISSGINKANFNKAISLIKTEIKNVEKGKISEEELEKAILNYITIIDEMVDYPSRIIASYYAMELLHADNPEERKKQIRKVTIQDVINLSKKIKMDTIYLLGGK